MATAPTLPFGAAWDAPQDLTITDVRAIVTAPEGIPLVVVRVDTSEPGLYGLGCATFTQRWHAVVAYIEEHLARLVVGRYPGDIADLTQLARFSGYWREGPVGNNAISGLDMALWDIAGKRAGLPVHELLGGRARGAIPTYIHAEGASIQACVDHAHALMQAGWDHVRLQVGAGGGAGAYGAPGTASAAQAGAPNPQGWDLRAYLRTTQELFAAARSQLGPEVNLLHDVHSRLTPKQAVVLARALEPYGLFFLEDVVAPEDFGQLPWVRQQCPVPIAAGELCTSFPDAVRLVTLGGVDFIRCHLSFIGGLSAGRKLAAIAEAGAVRTAWHGPGDTSPFGLAAALALEISSPAFGIHESHVYSDAAHEVFPGTPVIERGYIRPNDAPGWGIDLDERAAARYPAGLSGHDAWAAQARRPDGSLLPP